MQSSYGRVGISLSGRAVQETTAITTGMSAKYGRTGSGIIVQSSRAGADGYHGQLDWRHTDPFFNAYPISGNAPNNNHQNFYTASVGGPVWIPKLYKPKETFFHVDVEPGVFRKTVNVRGTFFTPDELAGHLANSLQTNVLQGGFTQIYAQAPINAVGLPAGPQISSSSNYVPIPNNDLSVQLANNPFAQYVFSLEPTPANPGPYVHFDNPQASFDSQGNNASYDRGVFNTDYRYNVRIDRQINQRSQVYVRYSTTPNVASRFFALSTDNPLSQSPTDRTISRDIAIGYTRVLSNNLVANFRYSWLRVNQTRTQNYSSTSQDFAGKYGLTPATSGVGFPNLGAFDTETLKPGSLTGFYALDQNFIVGQDFNYTRGNHLFQFGAEYRWIQSNQEDLSGVTGGTYSFSASQSSGKAGNGSSLATFILGTISTFNNSPQPIPEYYRWHYFAGYLQDDWRVTSKLTANIGVRYNIETPRMEKFNNQGSVVFQPGTLAVSSSVSQPVTAGFCFSGTCGLGRTLWPTNYAEVEPRIGLAYAVVPKVVVRGSYTISHLPLTGYGNMPRTNLSGGTGINENSGGQVNNTWQTNYLTNPASIPVGGYAIFNAQRGQPVYSSNTISPDYVSQSNQVPYIEAWSASVQFQPAPKSLLQLTYQGSRGVHLVGAFTRAVNSPSLPAVIAAIKSKAYLGQKFTNQYGVSGVNGVLSTETNAQALNPYQNFYNQPLDEIYPRNGSLKYNAFYASFKETLGRHLTMLASYVWSKTLDNIPDTTAGSEGGFGVAGDQNVDDYSTDYSLASYDFPSRLRVAFHSKLPLGPKGNSPHAFQAARLGARRPHRIGHHHFLVGSSEHHPAWQLRLLLLHHASGRKRLRRRHHCLQLRVAAHRLPTAAQYRAGRPHHQSQLALRSLPRAVPQPGGILRSRQPWQSAARQCSANAGRGPHAARILLRRQRIEVHSHSRALPVAARRARAQRAQPPGVLPDRHHQRLHHQRRRRGRLVHHRQTQLGLRSSRPKLIAEHLPHRICRGHVQVLTTDILTNADAAQREHTNAATKDGLLPVLARPRAPSRLAVRPRPD